MNERRELQQFAADRGGAIDEQDLIATRSRGRAGVTRNAAQTAPDAPTPPLAGGTPCDPAVLNTGVSLRETTERGGQVWGKLSPHHAWILATSPRVQGRSPRRRRDKRW